MTLLLADISNGRTKVAMARAGTLVSEVRVYPTAQLDAHGWMTLTAGWAFRGVALCSVVPAVQKRAEAFFASMDLVMTVHAAEWLPVDFCSYAGCASLGADRVANAVAAAKMYPGVPLAVIDAGTATTVDVVLPAEKEGEKPHFLGGAIAPGVGTMVRALHRGTAQLPSVPLAVPSHAVGQGTTEAIQNGCVRGYRGLLRELVVSMEHECGYRLQPVLTGGDAPLLAELMPELECSDPLLTLRGIAMCAESMKNVNFS